MEKTARPDTRTPAAFATLYPKSATGRSGSGRLPVPASGSGCPDRGAGRGCGGARRGFAFVIFGPRRSEVRSRSAVSHTSSARSPNSRESSRTRGRRPPRNRGDPNYSIAWNNLGMLAVGERNFEEADPT